MVQDRWYQVKTNGDGNVMEVYRLAGVATTAKKDATFNPSKLTRLKDFALDYQKDYVVSNKGVDLGEIAYTVQQGSSTVLYYNQDFITSRLRMNGRTLYVATDDQTGFIVNENVRYVIKQWDSNKKETYIEAESSGAAGLKNMIDEINRRNTNNKVEEPYTYQVSAVIDSGIASSVVIYFGENDYNRPIGGGDVNADFVTNIEVNAPYVNVTRTDVVTNDDQKASAEEVGTWLAAQGYTLLAQVTPVAPGAGKNHDSQSVMAWKNGTPVNLIIRWTDMYTVKVDDVLKKTVIYGTALNEDNLGFTQSSLGTADVKYYWYEGNNKAGNKASTAMIDSTADGAPFDDRGITRPITFETGYVQVQKSSTAFNVVKSGFGGGSEGVTVAGDGWKVDRNEWYVEAGVRTNIKVNITAIPTFLKDAKITVTGKVTGSCLVPNSLIVKGGDVMIPVTFTEDAGANSITVTIADEGTAVLPPKTTVQTPTASQLEEGVEEPWSTVQSGSSDAKKKWANKVEENARNQAPGTVFNFNTTMANAMKNTTDAPGATDTCIGFVFAENSAANDYYVLVVYKADGTPVCACIERYNEGVGEQHFLYFDKKDLSGSIKFTDSTMAGASTLGTGEYYYTIYNVGTANPSSITTSVTKTGLDTALASADVVISKSFEV